MARLSEENWNQPATPKGHRLSKLFRSSRGSSSSQRSSGFDSTLVPSPSNEQNKLQKGFSKVGLLPGERVSLDSATTAKQEAPTEKELEPKDDKAALARTGSPFVMDVSMTEKDAKHLSDKAESERKDQDERLEDTDVATATAIESAGPEVAAGKETTAQKVRVAELHGDELTVNSKVAGVNRGNTHKQNQDKGEVRTRESTGDEEEVTANYREETIDAIFAHFHGEMDEEQVTDMMADDLHRTASEKLIDTKVTVKMPVAEDDKIECESTSAPSIDNTLRKEIILGPLRITNPKVIECIDRFFSSMVFLAWTFAALRGPVYLIECIWWWTIALAVGRLVTENMFEESAAKFGFIWGEVLAALVEGYKEGFEQNQRHAERN